MDDLNKFVDAWERTGKIEDMLEAGLTLPTPAEARSFLSSLTSEEQAKIRTSLEQAIAAFSAYAEKLEQEAALLMNQINQNTQASNACLTYNKVPKQERP